MGLIRRRPAQDREEVISTEARASACYAPHSSLHFDPLGSVQACCETAMDAGAVTGPTRRSLRDIWTGAALAAQRAALDDHDYGLGCQGCEQARSTGDWGSATAAAFDRYASGSPHEWPVFLDLSLSSRCNLQCVMCNGDLSSSIRVKRDHLPVRPGAYDDRFFEELDEFLPHVRRMAFKGGEPVLAPENRRIWDRVIELDTRPEVKMTTNGTVLNRNVEHYVSALRIHPVISVDAMDPARLEEIRVGVSAGELWRNIDRYQELASEHGQTVTLSFCLMDSNWQELEPFLREVDRRGAEASVAVLHWPPQFDLRRLPRPQLQSICDALEASDPSFTRPSVESVWRNALDNLTGHLATPDHLVKRVELKTPSGRAALDERRRLDHSARASLIERLRRECGEEPIVVRTRAGRVDAVDAAAWSSWLSPETWPGTVVEGLVARMGEIAGPVRTTRVPSAETETWVVMIDTKRGPRSIEIHRYQSVETDEQELVIAPRPSPR